MREWLQVFLAHSYLPSYKNSFDYSAFHEKKQRSPLLVAWFCFVENTVLTLEYADDFYWNF